MQIEDQRALRLHQIARALRLDVDDFSGRLCPDSNAQQCLDLLDCFQKISNVDERARLIALARHLADATAAQTTPQG